MTDQLDDRFHAALIARAKEALGHWQVPKQEPELLKYRENAVFRVMLEDGKPAALRLHRPGYHGIDALKSELMWMRKLSDDNIDVPNAIPDSGHELVIELPANEAFAAQYADVVSWMNGSQLGESGTPLSYRQTERDALFRQVGARMADMHNSADAWQPPSNFFRPAWDADGLLGEKPLWGRFWDCDILSQADKNQLSALHRRLQASLDAVLLTEPDYGLIHADLIRENVLVRDQQVAFIDFDDCGYGFRLFDIATTLLRNRSEPDYQTLEAALIAGYRSRRSLSDKALATLPLFLTLRSLTYIGWLAERPEMPDVQSRLKRYVAGSLQLAKAGGFL